MKIYEFCSVISALFAWTIVFHSFRYSTNLFQMTSQTSNSPPLEVVCRIRPIEKEDPCVVASSERYVKLVPPPGAVSRSGEALVSLR